MNSCLHICINISITLVRIQMYFFAPSVDRARNNDNLVKISIPSIHILVSHTIFQLQNKKKKKERESFHGEFLSLELMQEI